MNIMPVSNKNTNFTGYYSEKVNSKNNKKELIYRPYSWENNQPQQQIDIFSKKLPDNDYIPSQNKDQFTDILGTKSYSMDSNGAHSKEIVKSKKLNREDSLKILNQKLDKFVELKQKTKTKLSNEIEQLNNNHSSASRFYDEWSKAYNRNYFVRDFSKSEIKQEMDIQKDYLIRNVDELYNKTNDLMTLSDSIIAVLETKSKNQEEINTIQNMRAEGKLIDISQQDILNANKSLKNALKNLKKASKMFICLPDKTISMKEIIISLMKNDKNINKKITSKDIMQKVEIMLKQTI